MTKRLTWREAVVDLIFKFPRSTKMQSIIASNCNFSQNELNPIIERYLKNRINEQNHNTTSLLIDSIILDRAPDQFITEWTLKGWEPYTTDHKAKIYINFEQAIFEEYGWLSSSQKKELEGDLFNE